MNGYLMVSCARNIRTENYYSWISYFQVTIDNVPDVFFGHGVEMVVAAAGLWRRKSTTT